MQTGLALQRKRSENLFIRSMSHKARHVLLGGLLAVFTGLMGCYGSSTCRTVEHRSLELTCEAENAFHAIHLDSAMLLETFLNNECQPSEDITRILNEVDFSKEVVFCASGPLNDPDVGCLRQRTVKTVESCTDGVQFLYEDSLQPTETSLCSNQLWTFCEVLNRNEVRNSLAGDSISETIAF